MIEVNWILDYNIDTKEFEAIPKDKVLKKMTNKDLALLISLLEIHTYKEIEVVNHYNEDIVITYVITYVITQAVKYQMMKHQARFIDYRVSIILNLVLGLFLLGLFLLR